MAKKTNPSKGFIAWPPPGSNEAVAQGCLCPVGDNKHGVGVVHMDGAHYWINLECKLHKKLKAD